MIVLERYFRDSCLEMLFEVVKDDHGKRLDQCIQSYYDTLSRKLIQKKIECGSVKVIGRSGLIKSSTRVSVGEKIVISFDKNPAPEEFFQGQSTEFKGKIPILYEDEKLIAVSKPPFLATHPTGRHLFDCVSSFIEKERGERVYAVHRLDRETSGVLILAKSKESASELAPEFEYRRVKKIYFFIGVKVGPLPNFPWRARYRLGPSSSSYGHNYFDPSSSEGKEAETEFHLLLTKGKYLFGLALPLTGRQHQIRLHALAGNFPLLGDKLYLGGYELFSRFKDGLASEEDHARMELASHALHAIALKLKGKVYLAPLPDHLCKWMSIL